MFFLSFFCSLILPMAQFIQDYQYVHLHEVSHIELSLTIYVTDSTGSIMLLRVSRLHLDHTLSLSRLTRPLLLAYWRRMALATRMRLSNITIAIICDQYVKTISTGWPARVRKAERSSTMLAAEYERVCLRYLPQKGRCQGQEYMPWKLKEHSSMPRKECSRSCYPTGRHARPLAV